VKDIPLADAAARRARLATRHLLAPSARCGTAAGVAQSLIALHGTDPASVFLAIRARTTSVDSAMIERALYEDRTLVRMLGMRRTMFVVPAELVPVIQAACTDQVAERMRADFARRLEQSGVTSDGAGWLKETGEATVAALAGRGAATGAELAQDVPRLREQIIISVGKSYGGPASMSSRVLMLLSAQGRIVRGRPRGGWTSSQYQWQLPGTWLPGQADPPPAEPARAELASRWLRAFGPATPADLQWWTGWTAGQVKAALRQLPVAEVDLDGVPGIMLAGAEIPRIDQEAWPALLPALDSTAMGWRGRTWYAGDQTAVLFDRSGNIGPSVWWNGQIVGGWAQRRDGEVVVRLFQDIGTEPAAAVAAEAGRLASWLGTTRVVPRFRTPLERELAG
jgi:hypothetical protein